MRWSRKFGVLSVARECSMRYTRHHITSSISARPITTCRKNSSSRERLAALRELYLEEGSAGLRVPSALTLAREGEALIKAITEVLQMFELPAQGRVRDVVRSWP